MQQKEMHEKLLTVHNNILITNFNSPWRSIARIAYRSLQ